MLRHDHHTHLWPHRAGTPLPSYDKLARRCEVAARAGVEVVAVTEHASRFDTVLDLMLRHWDRPGPPELRAEADRVLEVERGGDLDAYVHTLVDAKERGLPILVGLELDHAPGATAAIGDLLADYPFDLILGSVHWLDCWLFDAYDNERFGAEWRTRSVDEAYEDYVSAVEELLASADVDVVAHLDVIKVAGHRTGDPDGHHRRLVDAVVAADVAVEVSSAGWRKPIDEPYPAPPLLERLVAAGVPFTSASDAHIDEQYGFRFDELERVAERCGVRRWVTFDRRSRVPVADR